VRRVLSARTDPNSAFLALLGFLLLLLVFVYGGKKVRGEIYEKNLCCWMCRRKKIITEKGQAVKVAKNPQKS
jgi:hypothetical protein